ncbi:MAG: hypothetical protein GX277_02280 [Bacteroidales bacterium]|nr:hypothetical protein [Bacteroidales bacterium]
MDTQSVQSHGFIKKIAQKTVVHINKLEIIFGVILFVLVFTQTVLKMQVGAFVFIAFFMFIMLYYVAGLHLLQEESTMIEKFMHKITYFTLSISLMAMLFVFKKFQGSGTFLLISLIMLSLSILYLVFQYIKNPQSSIFTHRLRIRVVVVALLVTLILFFSEQM